jgi:hypothetical protein
MSRGIIATLVVLAVAVMLLSLVVLDLAAEVTVLRSQAASHADITLMDRDMHQMRGVVADVEFKSGDLSVRTSALEAKKPEVTTVEMQEFSTEISDAFNNLDARVQNLEVDSAKKRF